jgi:hypothetical protein
MHDETQAPCSAELISTIYQSWNSVFLSQQNNHSWLISRRNSLPNRVKDDANAKQGREIPAAVLQSSMAPAYMTHVSGLV